MFKPTKFAEATHFVPVDQIDKKGNKVKNTYHFYSDKSGLKVSCVEVTDEDIEEIKKTRRLYIVMSTEKFLPYSIHAIAPFKPAGSAGKRLMNHDRTLRINEKEEDKD